MLRLNIAEVELYLLHDLERSAYLSKSEAQSHSSTTTSAILRCTIAEVVVVVFFASSSSTFQIDVKMFLSNNSTEKKIYWFEIK